MVQAAKSLTHVETKNGVQTLAHVQGLHAFRQQVCFSLFNTQRPFSFLFLSSLCVKGQSPLKRNSAKASDQRTEGMRTWLIYTYAGRCVSLSSSIWFNFSAIASEKLRNFMQIARWQVLNSCCLRQIKNLWTA